MRILDRYIGQVVLLHTAIVMAVLLGMYTFSSFVSEISDVGKGDYDFSDAVLYTLMLIPRQAYELFPLVALLGSMLGLGALAGTSELTVIRAAGVSVKRLVVSVLKVGLIMVVAAVVIGETIAPPLEKTARVERAKALAKNISANTEDGLWARDGHTFVNIRRLTVDGQAVGITLYRFGDDQQLQEALTARSGTYQEGRWLLEGVKKSVVSEEGVETRTLHQEWWTSSLAPQVVNVVSVRPENLSVRDLYGFISYLRSNGLDTGHYELALWLRIVMPLATGCMVLLAVPFVFGSLRAVSVGQRIMVGALIGIGFYLFNSVFNRFGLVYDLPPFVAAVTPTVLVFMLWLLLMRKVR